MGGVGGFVGGASGLVGDDMPHPSDGVERLSCGLLLGLATMGQVGRGVGSISSGSVGGIGGVVGCTGAHHVGRGVGSMSNGSVGGVGGVVGV